jgi:DNA adenine methylase
MTSYTFCLLLSSVTSSLIRLKILAVFFLVFAIINIRFFLPVISGKIKFSIKETSSDVEIAARLIALNKTGYNGLYRLNKKGKYNVPVGKYKNPLICDSSNLENVSIALRYSNPIIFAGDYRNAIEHAGKGDFVYLDPPYDPKSSTSNFTAYTPNGFGREDQVQLAKVFRKLADRGCFVLLSNSDTPFIRELHSGYSLKEVKARRAINCKASKRKGHKELLIYNYS